MYWDIVCVVDGEVAWHTLCGDENGLAHEVQTARTRFCVFGTEPALVTLEALPHLHEPEPFCSCHGPRALLLALTVEDRRSLAQCLTCEHVFDLREHATPEGAEPECPRQDEHPPLSVLDDIERNARTAVAVLDGIEKDARTAVLRAALATGSPELVLIVLLAAVEDEDRRGE